MNSNPAKKKSIFKSGVVQVLAIVASFVGAGPTLAGEPVNNTFSPSGGKLAGDREVLIQNSNVQGDYGEISATLNANADIDYVVLSCGDQSLSQLKTVNLSGTAFLGALPGDMDIRIYDIADSGTILASGTNIGTNPEAVNVYGLGRSTLVARVYRHSGNIGTYYLRITCDEQDNTP